MSYIYDRNKWKIGDRVTIARKIAGTTMPNSDVHEKGWSNSWADSEMDPYINNGQVYIITGCGGSTGYNIKDEAGAAQPCQWPTNCFESADTLTIKKKATRIRLPRVLSPASPERVLALETAIGARGKTPVGAGNQTQIKAWLRSYTGLSFEAAEAATIEDLEAAYNGTDDAIAELFEKLGAKTSGAAQAAKMVEAIMKTMPALDEERIISIAEKVVRERQPTRIVVLDRREAEPARLDLGIQHHKFPLMIKVLEVGIPVALVGEASSGKTTAAAMAAKALGLGYRHKSFCNTTQAHELLGYQTAGGTYVGTPFREAYEDGHLFCADEFDNGNSNANAVINSALANDVCSFPDRIVTAGKRFVFVACMNTYGGGGDRMYVARNQLDAATLDRPAFISWDIDPALEASHAGVVIPAPAFKMDDGGIPTPADWLNRVHTYRRAVQKLRIRHLVSTRALIYGVQLAGAGVGIKHLDEMLIWKGLDKEQRDRVEKATKE
jgi:hypothetical protein